MFFTLNYCILNCYINTS